MKFWPVPDSYEKSPPAGGAPGSFWEDRGDRHHCGVDIYAPKGSTVHAIEDGEVTGTGVFTSPEKVPYWNTTYYVLVDHGNGLASKYAELGDVVVKAGDSVKRGQIIGHVGSVLNAEKITLDSPPYIQLLKRNGHPCMLHFELYDRMPAVPEHYLGGNVFISAKPDNLLDCTLYLKDTVSSSI
jgi:murein DD-endopeptidase MepM/ murein hydrolase activator NlpD